MQQTSATITHQPFMSINILMKFVTYSIVCLLNCSRFPHRSHVFFASDIQYFFQHKTLFCILRLLRHAPKELFFFLLILMNDHVAPAAVKISVFIYFFVHVLNILLKKNLTASSSSPIDFHPSFHYLLASFHIHNRKTASVQLVSKQTSIQLCQQADFYTTCQQADFYTCSIFIGWMPVAQEQNAANNCSMPLWFWVQFTARASLKRQ